MFESQRIYDVGELFHEGGVPEGYYEIEIGEPGGPATLPRAAGPGRLTARGASPPPRSHSPAHA